jgi:alpha-beta hydrolase superfamily lysophospholipase
MDSDEREHRLASSRSIARILFYQTLAGVSGSKVSTPTLFLVAGDDKIVDPAASIEIFKRLTVKDKALVEYPDMYHSLSIELGKEKVFEDLLKWVENRI